MSSGIPKAFEPYLRIGTCSWKYDSWKGLYYEPDKRYKPFDYLHDYAKHLNSVEIDQWFWSLFPGGVKLCDPETVKRYAESVPQGFTFTVKAPNALTLTHFYSRQPKKHAAYGGKPNPHFLSNDLLNRFLARWGKLRLLSIVKRDRRSLSLQQQTRMCRYKRLQHRVCRFDRLGIPLVEMHDAH